MAPIVEKWFLFMVFMFNSYYFIFNIAIFNMKKKQNELKYLIFIFLNYFLDFFLIFRWAYRFLLELELLIQPLSFVKAFSLCWLFYLLRHLSNLTHIHNLVYLITMTRNRLKHHWLSINYSVHTSYLRYFEIRSNLE